MRGGDPLHYAQGSRCYGGSNGEPVSCWAANPGSAGDQYSEGQRFLFKVEVGNKGILKAVEAKA